MIGHQPQHQHHRHHFSLCGGCITPPLSHSFVRVFIENDNVNCYLMLLMLWCQIELFGTLLQIPLDGYPQDEVHSSTSQHHSTRADCSHLQRTWFHRQGWHKQSISMVINPEWEDQSWVHPPGTHLSFLNCWGSDMVLLTSEEQTGRWIRCERRSFWQQRLSRSNWQTEGRSLTSTFDFRKKPADVACQSWKNDRRVWPLVTLCKMESFKITKYINST